jgi:CRP-like cAMP-binding protein
MPKVKHDIEVYRNILKDELKSISFVDDEQLNEFVSLFYLKEFKRKSIVILPKTEEKSLYFIISGLVRSYYIIDDKEIIADFIEEKSLFTNTYSIITGVPSIDYYEAMEDTVCLMADFQKLESLFQKNHSLERLARKIVEKYYSQFLIENYNKLFLSAEERLEIFTKERRALLERVSLKNVASYLGITPETLSRLRAQR